jgi:hypothetical protein
MQALGCRFFAGMIAMRRAAASPFLGWKFHGNKRLVTAKPAPVAGRERQS